MHFPGRPQQLRAAPEQGPSPSQKHALPTQALPEGAHSASAQQTPAKQEPPQQTLPVGQVAATLHG
jgi:hypothetical protein